MRLAKRRLSFASPPCIQVSFCICTGDSIELALVPIECHAPDGRALAGGHHCVLREQV